jgi:hypothetical protein
MNGNRNNEKIYSRSNDVEFVTNNSPQRALIKYEIDNDQSGAIYLEQESVELLLHFWKEDR